MLKQRKISYCPSSNEHEPDQSLGTPASKSPITMVTAQQRTFFIGPVINPVELSVPIPKFTNFTNRFSI